MLVSIIIENVGCRTIITGVHLNMTQKPISVKGEVPMMHGGYK